MTPVLEVTKAVGGRITEGQILAVTLFHAILEACAVQEDMDRALTALPPYCIASMVKVSLVFLLLR